MLHEPFWAPIPQMSMAAGKFFFGGYNMVFLRMGDPQVTIGFNMFQFNTDSWSNGLDGLGYPHDLRNLHMYIYFMQMYV
jgi:hypothetical protein